MWVVVALCSFVALAALVLCIPVDADLRVDVHGKASAQGRVRWLFGRVGTSFGAGERDEAPSEEKPKKPGAGKKQRKSAGIRSVELVWNLLHVEGLLLSMVRLIGRLLSCVLIRVLRVDFRVDLGDPADTVLLLGPLSQAALLAGVCSPYSFRLMPSFDGVLLAGEAEIQARLRPLNLVPPLLAFVFSPSTLKALLLVVRSRWKKNG